ncbi:VWA domain-containing protein [Candidatus Bathyarchaeota archaeon]|nr:VWA domain-containing protein [Candidatus Bathyarchaeota archaeon]
MGAPPNEFSFILVDTSNSMLDRSIKDDTGDDDGKKKRRRKKEKEIEFISRFKAAIDASKIILQTKKGMVETDQFGLIIYNDEGATLVHELTNDHDALLEKLSGLEMTPGENGGKKSLNGALSLVIQEFAKQLKFIGNLMLRVLILTCELTVFDKDVKRLTEIARDIGVYVDILFLGKYYGDSDADEDMDAAGFFIDEEETDTESLQLDFALKEPSPVVNENISDLERDGLALPGIEPTSPPGKTTGPTSATPSSSPRKHKHFNDIREISQLTDGLFLDGKETMTVILKHARKLGDIKDLEEGLGAFESAPVRKKKLISAIAEELVPLGIAEIQEQLEGKSDLKCNICFQSKSPNGAPFYATGRRCSYCQRTMHLECAAKWAEQDQGSEEPWIFRCPFCFHLLKVDPSVTKLMDLQTIRQNVARLESGKERKAKTTTASKLSPDQIMNIFEPCELCGVIFEADEVVYQCHNCQAAYHQKCFNQVLDQNERHCRRCGYEFSSW